MDILIKKNLHRSAYRGTKEMDRLLGAFYNNCFMTLKHAEHLEFDYLLSYDDPNVYRWIMGDEMPPNQLINIITALQKYHRIKE